MQKEFDSKKYKQFLSDKDGNYRKSRYIVDQDSGEKWFPEICKYVFSNFSVELEYLNGLKKNPIEAIKKDSMIGDIMKKMLYVYERPSSDQILRVFVDFEISDSKNMDVIEIL